MKTIQVNTVSGSGSTGKIVADLCRVSSENNIDAYVAYGRAKSPADLQSYKIGNPVDFTAHILANFFCGNSGFASRSSTHRFLTWMDAIQPDLLHLHNLHGFYLHVGLLFEYIKKRHIPIVWTLHDCWPFTGQCAYFEYANCFKWHSCCYECPVYRSDYPYSLFKDNSRQNYLNKKICFTGVEKMTIVTPSFWLADLVKQSFLGKYPVQVIHNGINLNIFSPTHSKIDILLGKKILLGVANVWDHRKGLDFFLQLADLLDDSFHIVLIGVSKKQQHKLQQKYASKITAILRTSDQQELAAWYCSAYAFVNPTLEDNFPTTNLEALACGTPVITFDTGGSPESITDDCGIVVKKGNTEQLKEAILSLETRSNITPLSCRIQALKYDKDVLFRQYLELYNTCKQTRN